MFAFYLLSTVSCRVVAVTSDAHHFSYREGVLMPLRRLNDASLTNFAQNYAQAKLANVLFARELSRRVAAQKLTLYANAAHPGLVDTHFARNVLEETVGLSPRTAAWLDGLWSGSLSRIGMIFDADEGALTQLYLAASDEVETRDLRGRYFVPVAGEAPFDPHAENDTLARALWDMSEALVARAAGRNGAGLHEAMNL